MKRSINSGLHFAIAIVLLTFSTYLPAAEPLLPTIDGDWWQVAGDPHLGDYTSPKQQPVDFGIWQAADGTWQLWSCIRHTNCGGATRLFHGWEGHQITDRDWTPKGIVIGWQRRRPTWEGTSTALRRRRCHQSRSKTGARDPDLARIGRPSGGVSQNSSPQGSLTSPENVI